jgi:hypothetical protein
MRPYLGHQSLYERSCRLERWFSNQIVLWPLFNIGVGEREIAVSQTPSGRVAPRETSGALPRFSGL